MKADQAHPAVTPGSYRTYLSVRDSISIDRYPALDVQEQRSSAFRWKSEAAPSPSGAYGRPSPAFAGRDLATAFPRIRHLDLTVDGATTCSTLQFQRPRIPEDLEGPTLVTVTAGGNDLVGLLDAGFDRPVPGVPAEGPAEETAADPVEEIADRLARIVAELGSRLPDPTLLVGTVYTGARGAYRPLVGTTNNVQIG